MAEEEKEEQAAAEGEAGKGGSNKLMLIVIILLVVLLGGVGAMMMMKDEGPQVQKAKPVGEYMVKEKMYQLKDGSYLRLGFTIVVDADKLGPVKEVIETVSPGRLPDSIHMLLGNKNREDLITGAHKREAFARELKKSLEEQVFSTYNKDKDPEEMIEVHDILILDYVTQSG